MLKQQQMVMVQSQLSVVRWFTWTKGSDGTNPNGFLMKTIPL